jgi:hypothetical protein
LKQDIFYENTVLEDLEKLTQLKNESNKQNYNELYNNVIKVDEYNKNNK